MVDMKTASGQADSLDQLPSEEDVVQDNAAWSEEEERTVRRKLDMQVVPMVTVLYLLCFLDRASIGNARIQGIAVDLNLTGYRFNWALSIFFFAYMVVEIPSNMLLSKFGPRFYIPALVIGFGFVSLCTAFTINFATLCVARVFLGIFEGGMIPGVSFYLSNFFKRRELFFRVGIYISAASMGGAFGGLLAAGLSKIPTWGTEAMPIHTWRNIFFFEGLVTMIIGALAPLILPQSPSTSTWLTDREKFIAVERLRLERNSVQKVKPMHIKRALLNINNTICSLGSFSINITIQSLSLFLPTILLQLGDNWSNTKAQLYSVPIYVCASIIALFISWISDKTGHRGIFLAGASLLSITGFGLLRWSDNVNVKYAATYLCGMGAIPGAPGFISWAMNNAAGTGVRAVTGGWIVTIGTLGGILATWTYLPDDGPGFPIGHDINFSAQVGCLGLALGGIGYCVWENGVRNRGGRDGRLEGLEEEEREDLGYRHPEFRYIH